MLAMVGDSGDVVSGDSGDVVSGDAVSVAAVGGSRDVIGAADILLMLKVLWRQVEEVYRRYS